MRTGVVSLLVLAGLLLLFRETATAMRIKVYSNIDIAMQTYEKIKQVRPSRIGGEEFLNIIHERIRCYSVVTTPLERNRPCPNVGPPRAGRGFP